LNDDGISVFLCMPALSVHDRIRMYISSANLLACTLMTARRLASP